jgi:ubiquinone/menaquinone biosynthesis C-methylase UbiE
MGFYDRHILPFLIDKGMAGEAIVEQRKQIVPRAEGRVLEVGFGSGHNLPYYDAAKVNHLWALEPATDVRARAARRIAQSPFPVEVLGLPGEEIPLEDESADSILITYTMCSIPDVARALGQMRRVLKTGGRMFFCEHGEAPDANVAKWQRRIDPCWGKFTGGCHLSRPIASLIGEAGFRIQDMETMYMPQGPRFVSYIYRGSASKA